MVRGVLITVEGCEGTGKSTQSESIAEALRSSGMLVTTVREPGGTPVGESVREILLDTDNDALEPRAELLLYEASRAQLVHQVVVPALVAGGAVVCDRFSDSTTAYQGYGRGLPIDEVVRLNAFATAGLTPDITIVLDLPPTEGLARATGEGADRLEAEEIGFHERVREGFLRIAEAEPERVFVVDATGSREQVAARVLEALRRVPVLDAVLH